MKNFSIKATNLNPRTIDPLLSQAVDLAENTPQKRREELIFSLNEVEFIDPYGLVALWSIIRYLKKRFRKIKVVLPKHTDLTAYLHRMNFLSMLEEDAQIDSTHTPLPTGPSDVLLQMTPVEKEGDVEKIIRDILEGVSRILKKELHYTDKNITAFSNVISELCNNILDHSEDKGVVAAQRYTPQNGIKYVIIGVADTGIGIRESLSLRYREAKKWSHIEAIAKAIKKEYSRNPNRGLGLHMVSKIMSDYHGSLHIRSGDARLYVRYRAQGIATAEFPGTQVYISLSAMNKENT